MTIKSRRKSNPNNSKINQAKINKIDKLAEKNKFQVDYDLSGQIVLYTGVWDHDHPDFDPNMD